MALCWSEGGGNGGVGSSSALSGRGSFFGTAARSPSMMSIGWYLLRLAS
jgi:hypothetical protein